MKKILAFLIIGAFISFSSCGDKKEEKKPEKITIQNKKPKKETPKAEKKVSAEDAALIAQGEKLFKDKTCFTCHQANKKVIGPSIVDINKIYKENNADIVKFLKNEMDPIVDTDPGQVAVMKANLDGFVKDLKDEELQALKAYMLSVE